MKNLVLRTEIVEVQKSEDGQAQVLVVFTDGNTKIQEWVKVYSEKEDDFKRTLQARVDRIQKTFDFVDTLIPGEYDLTPSQANQDELDRKRYLELLMTYNNVQNSIENGTLQESDPRIIQLASDLKAAFKPEYIGIG